MSDNKNNIISKIYNDPSGFGSIAETLKDAKAKDKSIKLEDVKEWFEKNVNKKTSYKGQNSFVAPHAYYEYQIDLFFIKHLEKQEFHNGMICIDVFTKYCVIVPIGSKNEGDLACGFLECLNIIWQPKSLIRSCL